MVQTLPSRKSISCSRIFPFILRRMLAHQPILALQLHSVFQVRALCSGLMGAPPERPSNDMGRLDAPLRKPCGDAADFLRRPTDEVTAHPPFRRRFEG